MHVLAGTFSGFPPSCRMFSRLYFPIVRTRADGPDPSACFFYKLGPGGRCGGRRRRYVCWLRRRYRVAIGRYKSRPSTAAPTARWLLLRRGRPSEVSLYAGMVRDRVENHGDDL
ncbi:hypothetical protein GWI33_019689 [Rhynchophorus ferrugineus]|uniref:Uncharacterized protein n=1 Tax=Rhynchophorus ferrugineus TaxID=354439 RepID=A0A834M405_RHYFE|nr:hypothetical protein GWI33_019689 [Rhynchophorus ferrugineus]